MATRGWEQATDQHVRGAIQAIQRPPTKSKYRAVKTTVDGLVFDSKKEAHRYSELKFAEQAKLIRGLETQPRWPIQVVNLQTGEITICGYFRADFRYLDIATGQTVVEDTKSEPTKTEAYRLRKKLVEAQHGITVREL